MHVHGASQSDSQFTHPHAPTMHPANPVNSEQQHLGPRMLYCCTVAMQHPTRRRKAAQSCTRMRPCTPEPEPEPERGDPQAQPAQLTETRVGQYLTSTRSFVTPQSPASIEAEERRQERQASPHGKQQQRFAAANPALRNLGGAVLISVQEGLVPSLLCNSTSLHPY